jgi:hypothetical protein
VNTSLYALAKTSLFTTALGQLPAIPPPCAGEQ